MYRNYANMSNDWATVHQNFTTTLSARNVTITRLAAGRYGLAFFRQHPDGPNYPVVTGGDEPFNTRDNPKVTVIDGTRTAAGCEIMVTQDDNGGGADILVDDPFSIVVKRY